MTYKAAIRAKRGHPLDDEATFDPELPRIVMPSERRANMRKAKKAVAESQNPQILFEIYNALSRGLFWK